MSYDPAHQIGRDTPVQKTPRDPIHQSYRNLFGRNASDVELAYWKQQANKRGLTSQSGLDALIEAAPMSPEDQIAHVQLPTTNRPVFAEELNVNGNIWFNAGVNQWMAGVRPE